MESLKRLIHHPSNAPPSNAPNAQVIQSPTNQGLILFRHFIKSEPGLASDADLEAVGTQAQSKCEVLEQ